MVSRWRTAAIALAVVVTAVIGPATGPVVRGQSESSREKPKVARAFQLIGGPASWIGVSVKDVDQDDLKRAKLTNPGGAIIEDVSAESPAAMAGLKEGDVVVEFDGERVRGTRQFSRLVQETPAGRKVPMTIVRDGQRSTMTIEPREGDGFRYLGSFDRFDELRDVWPVPITPKVAPPAPPKPPSLPNFFDDFAGRGNTRLGVTVGELSPQLAQYFGTKEGVLVTSVYDNSVAAKAGMKAGDVITSFNGVDVTSPIDLRRRMSRLDDGEEFTVGIMRDRKAMTIKGKLEARAIRRRTVI
jgi:serine protease Do